MKSEEKWWELIDTFNELVKMVCSFKELAEMDENWGKLVKIGENWWKLELDERGKFVYMRFFLPISCGRKYVHRHAKN